MTLMSRCRQKSKSREDNGQPERSVGLEWRQRGDREGHVGQWEMAQDVTRKGELSQSQVVNKICDSLGCLPAVKIIKQNCLHIT